MDPIDEIDFAKGGWLVTAIAQDDATGDILMVAYMNESRIPEDARDRERSSTGAARVSSSGTRASRAATPRS